MIELLQLRDFLQDSKVSDEALNVVAQTARASVESFLGYSLEYGEYTETFDGERVIYLSHAPVEKIVEVKIGGVTAPEADYIVAKRLGIIYFRTAPAESIEVTYRGGYKNPPEPLRSALFLVSQAVYQRLGSFGAKKESVQGYSVEYDDAEELPREAKRVLRPFVRPAKLW